MIERIAALVPPPRVHRHRYHGVLAPNSPLRAPVTALARDTATDEAAPQPDSGESSALDQPSRSPARYLWATLIARLFELFPLTCPRCGGDMEIIAFVTDAPTVRAILTHIGEPAEAPPLSPSRGPPAWEMFDQTAEFDPLDPEAEFDFDQRVSW